MPAEKKAPVIPYTGIPGLPSKLPSKNWFIAAAVVALPTYLWYDDRERAKALKQAYIDRVIHLSQVPLEGGAIGSVRKAAVYAGRWPGEEDGKAAAWFKRYLKVSFISCAARGGAAGSLQPLTCLLPFSALSRRRCHRLLPARPAQLLLARQPRRQAVSRPARGLDTASSL